MNSPHPVLILKLFGEQLGRFDQLVSCPVNSQYFSAPAKGSGKAHLAGNGPSPYQEVQRGQNSWLARPTGAYRKRHCCVASLENTTSILYGTRLTVTLSVKE